MRLRSGPEAGGADPRVRAGIPPSALTRPADAQIGAVLRTMREAVPATIPEAAALLFTTTDVIRSLEAGEISSLPPYAETRRIVANYGELLRMDVGPALRRLEQLMAPAPPPAAAQRPQPAPMSHPAPISQPAPMPQPVRTPLPMPPAEAKLPVGLMRRLGGSEPTERYNATTVEPATDSPAVTWVSRAMAVRRPLLFMALPAAGLLLAVVTLTSSRSALNASLSLLPDGVSKSVRQQLEASSSRVVVGPDGLKWVVVGDPRWRKADRLPVAKKP